MPNVTDPSPLKQAQVHKQSNLPPSPFEAATLLITSAIGSLLPPIQTTSLNFMKQALATFRQIEECKQRLLSLLSQIGVYTCIEKGFGDGRIPHPSAICSNLPCCFPKSAQRIHYCCCWPQTEGSQTAVGWNYFLPYCLRQWIISHHCIPGPKWQRWSYLSPTCLQPYENTNWGWTKHSSLSIFVQWGSYSIGLYSACIITTYCHWSSCCYCLPMHFSLP